jgi:hypothetical protein
MQGQEEDDRERFFEDDNFTFPPEGFNLDFQSDRFEIRKVSYTDKEIQMGAVAKSHTRKGFLIYEEMRKYLAICEEAVSNI